MYLFVDGKSKQCLQRCLLREEGIFLASFDSVFCSKALFSRGKYILYKCRVLARSKTVIIPFDNLARLQLQSWQTKRFSQQSEKNIFHGARSRKSEPKLFLILQIGKQDVVWFTDVDENKRPEFYGPFNLVGKPGISSIWTIEDILLVQGSTF